MYVFRPFFCLSAALFVSMFAVLSDLEAAEHAETAPAEGVGGADNQEEAQAKEQVSTTQQELMQLLAKKQLLFRYHGDTARDEHFEYLAELDPGREAQVKSLIFHGRKMLSEGKEEQGKVNIIKAINLLNNRLEREPRAKELYSMRSIAYEELGKFDQALADMQQVIKYTSRNADPMIKMANFIRVQNLENRRKYEQQ